MTSRAHWLSEKSDPQPSFPRIGFFAVGIIFLAGHSLATKIGGSVRAWGDVILPKLVPEQQSITQGIADVNDRCNRV